MAKHLDFEFISAAACRDHKVNNCLEVATNIPGVIALRESERPDVVVETTPERFALFVEAARAREWG